MSTIEGVPECRAAKDQRLNLQVTCNGRELIGKRDGLHCTRDLNHVVLKSSGSILVEIIDRRCQLSFVCNSHNCWHVPCLQALNLEACLRLCFSSPTLPTLHG